MVQRQLPKIPELLELMQFKTPELDGVKRRLEGALTIADLRRIAKRRTPKAAFDYTHLGREGADFFAAIVADELARQVPALRRNLIP